MIKKVKVLSIAVLALTATLGAKRLVDPMVAAYPVAIDGHESAQTMTAAFRDGVFQARLSVERGQAEHLSLGRWNSDQDRASFIAGYQQSYRQEMPALHKLGTLI
jgi:hypothetical protein